MKRRNFFSNVVAVIAALFCRPVFGAQKKPLYVPMETDQWLGPVEWISEVYWETRHNSPGQCYRGWIRIRSETRSDGAFDLLGKLKPDAPIKRSEACNYNRPEEPWNEQTAKDCADTLERALGDNAANAFRQQIELDCGWNENVKHYWQAECRRRLALLA